MLSVALSITGLNAAANAGNISDRFLQNLSSLCGQTYIGQAVENETTANPFGQEQLVMHVKDCSDTEIRIAFHVGQDRSRTWVVSQTDNGLQLKHIHLDEDGNPDSLSLYGGLANSSGTEWRQEFPVDAYSKDLFTNAGITPSLQNVWSLEIIDQALFAYDLTRPAYHVRVEFDLTNPVPAPAPVSK